MNADDARTVRIGEWQVDPRTNELTRNGETVHIEPRAMDVLMVLAREPARVVGRDELLATVWNDLVVGEEALTQSVIKLRRAFSDDSRSPRYIETIPKRGYRLIAPVQRADRPGDAAAPMPAGPPRRFAVERRWLVAAGIVVFAILAVALGAIDRLDRSGDAAAPGAVADYRLPASITTVTVVPFEALDADREQGYLARGISENLVTDLSGISGLRVIRSSGNPASAASDGGAAYRVVGTLQQDAATLQLNVHLVDARSGETVWSARLERPAHNLLALQKEVTASILALLPAKVSEVERQRLAVRYTRSFEAYEAFLRGRALLLVRRSAENEEARTHLRKAIELDPGFARAYASLAMTYALERRLDDPLADPRAAERARELAETARAIDPAIPEVYWALGFVHAQNRRHREAIASLRKAIELDRSFADAYALLGGIYTYVGRPAESIPLLRTAMRLNPEGGYLYYLVLGRAYLFQGDHEQAVINLRAAALRNPVDIETRAYLAAALGAAGQHALASWEIDEIRTLQPGFTSRDWLRKYPMTDKRQEERLASLLAAAGL